MTLWESTDNFDVRRALSGPEPLAEFNAAGVLEAADVHVAVRTSALAAETNAEVHLAVALAVRAVRHGSVCLDLTLVHETTDGLPGLPGLPWPEPTAWLAAIERSPLVAAGVIRVEHGLVYLARYHQQERQIVDIFGERASRPAPAVDQPLLEAALDRLFTPTYAEQRAACAVAASRWTTVLTGGPGTGKTTTVARLLAVLGEQLSATRPEAGKPRIALAAPTGKAAARMQEQIRAAAVELAQIGAAADAERLRGLEAVTLHRLLGYRHGNRTRFRHDAANRLPYDLIVVDESSMVSLTLMARLMEAVRPDSRLVLVGDPDQLASVEAGAVLADLVTGYATSADSPVVQLRTVHRFGTEIGALAAALRDGDADAAVAALEAGHPDVVWIRTDSDDPDATLAAIREVALPAALAIRERAVAGDEAGALAALNRHRLLSPHRDTVGFFNRRIEEWLREVTGDQLRSPMYLGRPLLVTSNDRGLGLYNGDTGVVVGGSGGQVRAVIAGALGPVPLAPGRLAEVETMHAMTIHKSQGSQAEEVTVVLPAADSRLLTRELLYTAVTRASDRIRIVGSEEALRAAIGRRVQRASGLALSIASDV